MPRYLRFLYGLVLMSASKTDCLVFHFIPAFRRLIPVYKCKIYCIQQNSWKYCAGIHFQWSKIRSFVNSYLRLFSITNDADFLTAAPDLLKQIRRASWTCLSWKRFIDCPGWFRLILVVLREQLSTDTIMHERAEGIMFLVLGGCDLLLS